MSTVNYSFNVTISEHTIMATFSDLVEGVEFGQWVQFGVDTAENILEMKLKVEEVISKHPVSESSIQLSSMRYMATHLIDKTKSKVNVLLDRISALFQTALNEMTTTTKKFNRTSSAHQMATFNTTKKFADSVFKQIQILDEYYLDCISRISELGREKVNSIFGRTECIQNPAEEASQKRFEKLDAREKIEHSKLPAAVKTEFLRTCDEMNEELLRDVTASKLVLESSHNVRMLYIEVLVDLIKLNQETLKEAADKFYHNVKICKCESSSVIEKSKLARTEDTRTIEELLADIESDSAVTSKKPKKSLKKKMDIGSRNSSLKSSIESPPENVILTFEEVLNMTLTKTSLGKQAEKTEDLMRDLRQWQKAKIKAAQVTIDDRVLLYTTDPAQALEKRHEEHLRKGISVRDFSDDELLEVHSFPTPPGIHILLFDGDKYNISSEYLKQNGKSRPEDRLSCLVRDTDNRLRVLQATYDRTNTLYHYNLLKREPTEKELDCFDGNDLEKAGSFTYSKVGAEKAFLLDEHDNAQFTNADGSSFIIYCRKPS